LRPECFVQYPQSRELSAELKLAGGQEETEEDLRNWRQEIKSRLCQCVDLLCSVPKTREEECARCNVCGEEDDLTRDKLRITPVVWYAGTRRSLGYARRDRAPRGIMYTHRGRDPDRPGELTRAGFHRGNGYELPTVIEECRDAMFDEAIT